MAHTADMTHAVGIANPEGETFGEIETAVYTSICEYQDATPPTTRTRAYDEIITLATRIGDMLPPLHSAAENSRKRLQNACTEEHQATILQTLQRSQERVSSILQASHPDLCWTTIAAAVHDDLALSGRNDIATGGLLRYIQHNHPELARLLGKDGFDQSEALARILKKRHEKRRDLLYYTELTGALERLMAGDMELPELTRQSAAQWLEFAKGAISSSSASVPHFSFSNKTYMYLLEEQRSLKRDLALLREASEKLPTQTFYSNTKSSIDPNAWQDLRSTMKQLATSLEVMAPLHTLHRHLSDTTLLMASAMPSDRTGDWHEVNATLSLGFQNISVRAWTLGNPQQGCVVTRSLDPNFEVVPGPYAVVLDPSSASISLTFDGRPRIVPANILLNVYTGQRAEMIHVARPVHVKGLTAAIFR